MGRVFPGHIALLDEGPLCCPGWVIVSRGACSSWLLGAILLQAGCAVPASEFLAVIADPAASPAAFTVCQGYGCRYHSRVSLSEREWGSIRAEFAPPANAPEAEREQLGRAVARLELLVGRHAGIATTQRRELINYRDTSQTDCVDETVNVSTYLALLARDGLLRWHRVAAPVQRGTALTLDVANASVLVETGSGRKFAVDSAYGDPGIPPGIVSLDAWLAGWRPATPG